MPEKSIIPTRIVKNRNISINFFESSSIKVRKKNGKMLSSGFVKNRTLRGRIRGKYLANIS